MAHLIDASRLRPQRRWYAVAAAIGVLSVLAAVGALVLISFLPDTSDPDFDNILIGDGQRVDVPLTANRAYGVYVLEGTPARCVFGPGVTASPPATEFTFLHDDESWKQAYVLTAASDGLYQVTCDAESFAVGEPPPDPNWVASTVGSTAVAFVGLPCVGVPAAVVGATIVAALRSSNRRRLLQRHPHL